MNMNTSAPLLIQMMMSLSWRDILILHDDRIDAVFFPTLDMHNITYISYDISSSTDKDLLTVLTETHHLVQPVLHLVLLCDHQLTLRVLQQMETFDAVSRFGFDIRHSSRVLIVGDWRELDSIVTRNTLVENVAVVEMRDDQTCNRISTVRTLVFAANGRIFTHVSLHNWPTMKLSSIFPNTQYGYNGRQLTVVMKHYKFEHGSVTVGNKIVFGMSYRTLEYVAQFLNFSINVVYPREDEWGKNINGSWTGVVGMLQRKEADLAAEPLTVNSVRESVIDHLLPPLTENLMMIVYKMDNEDDNLEVFLHPFQTVVYIALIGTLFVYSLLLCFERLFHKIQLERDFDIGVYLHTTLVLNKRISHLPDEGKQLGSKIGITFLTAFQEGVMAALRQGLPTTASRAPERLLVACWWIFTIIITSIYCGAILSSFAVKIQKPPFSSLGELAEKQQYTIGYDSSSIISTYLKVSTNADAIMIRNRVKESATTDPDVLSSDVNKHYDRVEKGKYALLINDITAVTKLYSNCMYKAIDSKFGAMYYAFAVPKQSPFKKDFEWSMYRLQDNGVLQQIEEKWMRSIPQKRCEVDESHQPISLSQLQSIFIVVGVGICCAAMVLLVEKICFKVITTVPV